MFESSHRSTGGSSANRWLIVAGAGLVILAFVARMLLDIGHTKVSDLAGVLKPDTTAAQTVAPAVVTPEAAPDSAPTAVVDTPTAPVPVPTPPTAAATAVPVRVAKVTPPILKLDTTPHAAAPTTPQPPPAASGTGYAVQIGAFGSEANADKLRERASKLGYTATVIPQHRGTSDLYLVRVRGLTSVEAARQASDSLARTLGVTSVVVPPGR